MRSSRATRCCFICSHEEFQLLFLGPIILLSTSTSCPLSVFSLFIHQPMHLLRPTVGLALEESKRPGSLTGRPA